MCLYSAPGCHLCEAALEVVSRVRADVAFDLQIVDVSLDPELERLYRERIPVIEIDGVAAFTFFVTPDGLRERLGVTR